MAEIVFVKGDDWTAMYVDGKRVAENHSLSSNDVLNALGVTRRSIYIEREQDWDAINSHCPENLADLEEAISTYAMSVRRY